MDFRKICDSIDKIACVVSVQKTNNGYGEIRIIDGNEKYLSSFKYTEPGNEKPSIDFIPNSLYTRYLPRNLHFENYCYRSAVKKELLHSYAYPENTKAWFHMLFIPMEYETEDLSYCIYIMDINTEFDSNVFSSATNDIAARVLKTTLQLSNTRDFKVSLHNVIKDIREMCKASFCCILLIDKEKEELNVLAEDRDLNSDRLEMKDYMDDNFYNLACSWIDTIGNSNCLILSESNLDFIKEKNPKWYDSIIKSKIKSLVLFPLKSREKLMGYIWVSNFETKDQIKIKETLELTTFILESEISNYLLLNKFKELSSIDLLTGVCNRNEMNNYVDKLVKSHNQTPIGVIFLDVNGLKHLNDTEGHLAGDELIKKAANVLKLIFRRELIFRAGGDEFTIIIEDATKEQFESYIEQIKKEAAKQKVSFAVGYSIENSFKKVLKALREADEKMYDDKKEYYDSIK